MKKIKFLLAMLTVVALFGGVGVVKANTAAKIASGATNSVITIERKVTGASSPVTNTFTYTIAADANNPATATGVPVGTKTVVMNGQALSSGTATQSTTISFVNATFPRPGDYIYTITETGTTDSTTYPLDTTNKYTVKVSVRNHAESDFTTAMDATILLYSGTGSSITKITTGKAAFTKAAAYKNITIAKTVKGTMAETDKYFTVKLTINGLAGETFAISGQASGSGGATACTIASGATSCTANLKLKHGDTATISGLRSGQTYNFEETDGTDYSVTINGTASSTRKSATLTVGNSNANTILNEKNQDPLTGFATRTLPYILIVLIAAGAITYVVIKNSKSKKSDMEI